MPAEAQTKVEPQAEAEAKMVDLPSDGPSVDVELPTDTTKTINPDVEGEAVQPEVKVETPSEDETASTAEMDEYGKKVQSRIDKLTKKLREAERREQAAIQYAQGIKTENQDLRTKAQSLDDGYVQQYENRVKTDGFDGNLFVNVKQIQFDREKKQDYYKFSISLSLEFLEKNSSTNVKTYNVNSKEYGEIVGSFAIKDQDNLDINLMHKSLESISSKLMEVN